MILHKIIFGLALFGAFVSLLWLVFDFGFEPLLVMVASVATTITTGMHNFRINRKRESGPLFSLSYMRLFGAVETPLFMQVMANNAPIEACGEGIPYFKLDGKGSIISQELYNFWTRKWKYRNVQPLRTKLWDQYSGDKLKGLSAYLSALSPSFEDVISFGTSRDVDESFCMGDDIAQAHGREFKHEWYDSPPGMQSSDIGFLFLVLESSMHMSDITLEWRQYINPLKEREFPTDALTTPLASWTDPAHEALTDELIAQTAPILQSMKIADAKKEESFIWILGAYRSGKTGLPKFWLTDVSVPVQATASINGKSVTQLFRKPYLEKAAKVSVPNGWFHQ